MNFSSLGLFPNLLKKKNAKKELRMKRNLYNNTPGTL